MAGGVVVLNFVLSWYVAQVLWYYHNSNYYYYFIIIIESFSSDCT